MTTTKDTPRRRQRQKSAELNSSPYFKRKEVSLTKPRKQQQKQQQQQQQPKKFTFLEKRTNFTTVRLNTLTKRVLDSSPSNCNEWMKFLDEILEKADTFDNRSSTFTDYEQVQMNKEKKEREYLQLDTSYDP
jgi:hypothetical protein